MKTNMKVKRTRPNLSQKGKAVALFGQKLSPTLKKKRNERSYSLANWETTKAPPVTRVKKASPCLTTKTPKFAFISMQKELQTRKAGCK
jgi:hypothetical protein